jgi:hypothetical protein
MLFRMATGVATAALFGCAGIVAEAMAFGAVTIKGVSIGLAAGFAFGILRPKQANSVLDYIQILIW